MKKALAKPCRHGILPLGRRDACPKEVAVLRMAGVASAGGGNLNGSLTHANQGVWRKAPGKRSNTMTVRNPGVFSAYFLARLMKSNF